MTKAEIIPAYCLRIGEPRALQDDISAPIEVVRDGDHDVALLTNIDRINTVVESNGVRRSIFR